MSRGRQKAHQLQHNVGILLDCVGLRGFECSDITAARKVGTAVRSCKHMP
jgi:hypothetical protein